MDLLSDVLKIVKLSGTLYFRTSFSSPWGVQVPPFQNVSRFHYVHRGRCFARVDNHPDTVLLDQGDLIIINAGSGHCLSDPAEVEIKTLDQVVESSGFNGRGALVIGEPNTGHETQLICGHFAFDPDARHILLDALPPYIHIREYGNVSPDWLNDSLRMIGSEAGGGHLGSDLIGLKLAEIIFTQALRNYVTGPGSQHRGLAGFADNHIREALTAIHENPAHSWSVESLARQAGMSRTAFSNRFNELVTRTPLTYLTEWRMQLARHLLSDTDLPIIEVAIQVGYGSEASFSRTFKKYFDTPPAVFRRTRKSEA
ncbi:MAG: AraC family transcriptional regulator [Pseudomonadota bacterium]